MNGNFNCTLCPRKCGANRPDMRGVCGADTLKIARAAPHYFEEPPVSGKNGSGAIFFSGCPLSCVFCQNHNISSECFGKFVTADQLAQIMRDLQNKDCHNINLVSPTPYINEILQALDTAGLSVPVVCNSSGYERVETLKMLNGYVDVYLPDFKYVSSDMAKKYSGAANYPDTAAEAIGEMISQCGKCEFDGNGIIKKGVIIRHLVLPSHKDESIKLLEFLSRNFDKSKFMLSLMAQYTPMFKACEYPEINRKLTKFEYRKVAEKALSLGFNGYFQELSSHTEEYTPDFDFTGLPE